MTANPKKLSDAECKAIRDALLSEPFKNICRVVSGMIDSAQIEAINDRRMAGPDNNRSVSSEHHEMDANRYAAFLSTVNELRTTATTEGIFHVVEISPTK